MGKRDDGNETIRRLVGIDRSSLPADGGPDFNRLIFSTSPYLLQHAANPVDWYLWGDEAFARARAEEKPVFLSIGYATCHWCHVMAHESFEDREVASVMNRDFVSIKVDREERPDIDEQYMAVSQLMTGGGGWPLNVFLTPDRRPFLTVTYMPKMPRMGMLGFIGLLENIATLWRSHRDRIDNNCAAVMASLRQMTVSVPGPTGEDDLAGTAFRQLDAMYDPEWGGFGGAPKFPMPTYLSFLLRYGTRSGDSRALAMVEQTLRQIRCGGIYDQVGFGVHRYSVDRQWLTPHFEKMLYDQALMATVYVDAFRATGDRFFMTVADEIFAFVESELTSPEGGFYAALDADSEGEEGRFYVWTDQEIRDVLGARDGEICCRLFGVTPGGNFEGATILSLPLSPEEFALGNGIDPTLLAADIERWRHLLLAGRGRRVRPLRDEKVLTAWNGLMIDAVAHGYAATGDARYRLAAERGVDFLERRLVRADGRVMRSFHAGQADVPGFLEDYAYVTRGLLTLYGATLDERYLERALWLGREMLRLFRDDESGGLFATGSDVEAVLVRGINVSDGVLPAAGAVAAENLVRLGRITDAEELITAGREIVASSLGPAARQPVRYLQLITVREMFDVAPVEITFAGKGETPEMSALLRLVGRRFIPDLVIRHEAGGEGAPEARVCARGACLPPVGDGAALGRLLDETV